MRGGSQHVFRVSLRLAAMDRPQFAALHKKLSLPCLHSAFAMLTISVHSKVLFQFLKVETQQMELERQKLHTTFYWYFFPMFWSVLQWTKILFLLADSLILNLVPLSTYFFYFPSCWIFKHRQISLVKEREGKREFGCLGFFWGVVVYHSACSTFWLMWNRPCICFELVQNEAKIL